MNYYWSLKEVHEKLDYHMSRAYRAVHDMHDAQKVHMRLAAYLVAVSRVADAVKLRGWI
jgi:glutamate dehydrogenase (NAD(P)+)